MIRRLLIANRGEIAVRIARAARELGIAPLGVFTAPDERAAFRDALDDAVHIGSYLDADAIVAAARALRADAVHPGYGFLSERAPFAQAVRDAGIAFVGPPTSAIAAMGSKIEAKRLARAAGVAVVPGYDGDDQGDERLRAEAGRIGPPVLVKASAGGGGRGMRVVEDLAAFDDALATARREAKAAFGDDTMLLERYVSRPRHVEIQVLGDDAGALVHLGERECSLQRRHQKVIEEAPSVALDDATRARMGDAAVAFAARAGYSSAGTVEFILDADGAFYFLEMNARLQVEHPVTELVYGVDLVHEQLRIAGGERLRLRQETLVPRGWAIEARLNAEDPERDFLPQAGTLGAFEVPAAPGIRVDAGVRAGSEIPLEYDSLVAKIVAWAPDRDTAVDRLGAALAATRVTGIPTNLPLLRAVLADPTFRAGKTTTRFFEERIPTYRLGAAGEDDEPAARAVAAALLARGGAWRLGGVGIPLAFRIGTRTVRAHATRDGARWDLAGDLGGAVEADARDATFTAGGGTVTLGGRLVRWHDVAPPSSAAEGAAGAAASGDVTAPMPGKIVSVAVVPGAAVEQRALLLVLEAMKMEHRIEAPIAGTVREVRVRPGELVGSGATLVRIGS